MRSVSSIKCGRQNWLHLNINCNDVAITTGLYCIWHSSFTLVGALLPPEYFYWKAESGHNVPYIRSVQQERMKDKENPNALP